MKSTTEPFAFLLNPTYQRKVAEYHTRMRKGNWGLSELGRAKNNLEKTLFLLRSTNNQLRRAHQNITRGIIETDAQAEIINIADYHGNHSS